MSWNLFFAVRKSLAKILVYEDENFTSDFEQPKIRILSKFFIQSIPKTPKNGDFLYDPLVPPVAKKVSLIKCPVILKI